ncbi:MAG: cysteine hydrolase [Chloroflexi bacterium]|nr:cysteine hydrolase [Chloroflexota bacterium]
MEKTNNMEHTSVAIERETGRRALEVARSTITRLEKRVRVLEAQVEECRHELSEARPALPSPERLTLDAKTTALLVLDLGARCADPRIPCHRLVPVITDFLKKARQAGVFVVYTIIHQQKGKPEGAVFPTFDARPEEPVIYPDGYSKFVDGELQKILSAKGIKTVIVTGSSANFAVLYTATDAAQRYNYEVVAPADGVVSWTPYEHHYSLFQLTVLPGGVAQRVHLTELGMISFGR